MNDIIGNVAQELADHLDDLMDSGEGVTDFDNCDREFPVTEISDAEADRGMATLFKPSVSFTAVIGGQRVMVTVAAVMPTLADQVADRPNLWEGK